MHVDIQIKANLKIIIIIITMAYYTNLNAWHVRCMKNKRRTTATEELNAKK